MAQASGSIVKQSDHAQVMLDGQNAAFWNELCGSGMARSLGITELSSENLRRFDHTYLTYYPYLASYVESERLQNKKVLEIGIGSGTLGQLLASHGCRYYGLDIAPNPVSFMRYRLSLMGQDGTENVRQGSALNIPFGDQLFDYVYSIGCLHHTGDLPRAVSEVYRVLKPGGKAVIMLYHRHSLRQLVKGTLLRLRGLYSRVHTGKVIQHIGALYDTNRQGDVAPHIDYVSRKEVRTLFNAFRDVRIDSQNMDALVWFNERLVIPREKFLNNLARIAGLDLYVRAVK